MILTRGESADGILIQSIGGAGGAGDALSTTGAQKSAALEIGLGGKSSGGGGGFDITATKTGAILTLGDGAHGILAQTIGGGGGRAGGGAASNSGTIVLGVAIGATGGNGGDTWTSRSGSQVTNTGSILTFGADAGGILAQPIGGGAGGKAGTTLGSQASKTDGSNGNDVSTLKTLSTIAETAHDHFENGLSAYQNLKTLLSTANSILGFANSDNGNVVQYLDDTASDGGDIDLSNVSTRTSFTVAVGGKGGTARAGGNIAATNSGAIATIGIRSDANIVQSVGGGRGKGGATNTAAADSRSSPGANYGVAVGG